MASSLLTLGLEATAGTFADCALRKHTSQLLHIKRVSHCTPKKTPLTYTGDGRFIHLEERFRFASVQWLVMADQEAANVKLNPQPAPAPMESGPAPTGPGPVPGDPLTVGQMVLNTATSTLQSFKPLSKICQHVCAFHCYAHDTTRQVRAHHFCSHVNEEMRQCVIYDGPEANARLIGVEYIISRRLFEGLPEEEKHFWHSHVYEVTSGQLAALDVPLAASNLDAHKLIDTYGKTWHFWQVDLGHDLPLGPPQLMMSFTADGQLDPSLLQQRDTLFNLNTDTIKQSRVKWAEDAPTPHPAADHPWRTGPAWTSTMQLQEAKIAGSTT